MDKNKLILPIAIILGCIVLGGSFFAVQASKQKSIEKQQQIELQAKEEADQLKVEQEKKEYIVKRKKDCYEIETSERKKFNNVDGSFYREETDICVVRFTTNEYKGEDCAKYKDTSLWGSCVLGVFTKEF